MRDQSNQNIKDNIKGRNSSPSGLTTRTLDQVLTQVNDRKSLDQYLQAVDAAAHYDSFLAYFRSLDKVKALSDAQLQKGSDIERSYCYHVLDGSKMPGRDKILRLCLAAGLDNTETRRALEAGKVPVLYAKNRRDAIIRFAIGKHLTVAQTNLLLTEYKLDPLR